MALEWKHTKAKMAAAKLKLSELKTLQELLDDAGDVLAQMAPEDYLEPGPLDLDPKHTPGVDHSPPIHGQVLAIVDFDQKGDYEAEGTMVVADSEGIEHEVPKGSRKRVETLVEANVVTSLIKGTDVPHDKYSGMHNPVIDIDVPVHLVPSTTPGHGHLYFEHAMPWADLKKLLEVMVEVGLVEPGYLGASDFRGHTCVRLPGLKKGPEKT